MFEPTSIPRTRAQLSGAIILLLMAACGERSMPSDPGLRP